MLNLIAQAVSQPGLTNPAVKGLPEANGDSGQVGAEILGKYIAIAITSAVALGGLAVLIYFILGAINWITAGGDKGKIEKAQQRIIQAFIGFALLVFSVTILQWIGPTLFGIDLLKVEFINQLSEESSTGKPSWYSQFMKNAQKNAEKDAEEKIKQQQQKIKEAEEFWN